MKTLTFLLTILAFSLLQSCYHHPPKMEVIEFKYAVEQEWRNLVKEAVADSTTNFSQEEAERCMAKFLLENTIQPQIEDWTYEWDMPTEEVAKIEAMFSGFKNKAEGY